MSEALIFEAVRTPRGRGKANGSLHGTKPIDLVVGLIHEVRRRFPGWTRPRSTTSCSAWSPRSATRAPTSPRSPRSPPACRDTVAGVQQNRFCASGLEAVNLAAQKVRSGWEDLVLAGGVESMSRVPMGSDGGAWAQDPKTNFDTGFVPQGIGADLIATIEGFTREDVDAYAARVAGAGRQGVGQRPLQPLRRAGARPQRPRRPRPATSTCGPAPRPSPSPGCKPSFATIGELGGFDAVALQKYHWVERDRPRPPRRQLLRHRRRRRARRHRQRGGRRALRAHPARPDRLRRGLRRRPDHHADRARARPPARRSPRPD